MANVRRIVASLCVTLASTTAHADPASKAAPREPKGSWYRGPYAPNRFLNLAVTGALGVYLLQGSVFDTTPIATSCRWCDPPGFDKAARHTLLWGNTGLADSISSYEAYIFAPVVGLTLVAVSDSDASSARLLDDLLPVVETVAVVQVATQLGKYAFARERPYARYGTRTAGATEDDSFWSGHSAFGFAITSAAGTVCHFRHYWTEPYVWGAGIALSLSVEYLRIAADKHYLSDVAVGGFVGIGAGLLVPRLMQRNVKIVPVKNGLALAGSF